MAYSSCRSLVYACPVLATPMRAFIHDVSPGLASLVGASSTSSSSVYACPVLATPVRAFDHGVSLGLANPPRRVVNNIFFLTYVATRPQMVCAAVHQCHPWISNADTHSTNGGFITE